MSAVITPPIKVRACASSLPHQTANCIFILSRPNSRSNCQVMKKGKIFLNVRFGWSITFCKVGTRSYITRDEFWNFDFSSTSNYISLIFVGYMGEKWRCPAIYDEWVLTTGFRKFLFNAICRSMRFYSISNNNPSSHRLGHQITLSRKLKAVTTQYANYFRRENTKHITVICPVEAKVRLSLASSTSSVQIQIFIG